MNELFLLEDVLRETEKELIPGYTKYRVYTWYTDTKCPILSLQLLFVRNDNEGTFLTVEITNPSNLFSIEAKLDDVKDKIEMNKLELDKVIPSLAVVGRNVKILEEEAEKKKSEEYEIKDKLRKQLEEKE